MVYLYLCSWIKLIVMDSITIKEIRGIRELNYPLLTEKGVYLLTGSNGSGKTSLLTALDRLGNPYAFQNGFKDVTGGEASITFTIQGKNVVYKKRKKRWTPTPKSLSQLLHSYTYSKTYFLRATELRFYITQATGTRQNSQDVSQGIKDALNDIFGTQKFSNLKYCVVSSMRGRQSRLRRDNKLYVIEETSSTHYTEQSFSLGERMVLNALDFLETIEEGGMLLIDEVELALHPIAQVRFYKLLKSIANEKNLVVIISTHSSSLIKVADKIHYLENSDGKIQVINDVKPAYILKDLSIELDICPDYLFFVEDEMARTYLTKIINIFKEIESTLHRVSFKILPVGGYKQVLTLMTYFYGVQPFTQRTVHSFLDKDVEIIYNSLQDNTNRSSSEEELFRLMNDNRSNYNFLPITPELGIWDELTRNPSWFETALQAKYSDILFKVGEIVSEVDTEEGSSNNPRKRAKGCYKNLFDKILQKKPEVTESVFRDILFEAYVRRRFEDVRFKNEIRGLIYPILNR